MKNLPDQMYFMREALKEAEKARHSDEVPVGAIVVIENKIIARAHNMTQTLNDVTAHAEMVAITSASNYLNSKYLINCSLYVTLEPCVMCAGAIFWSQIKTLVYAASDLKRGFSIHKGILHPKTKVLKGEYEKESLKLLKDFFKSKRK